MVPGKGMVALQLLLLCYHSTGEEKQVASEGSLASQPSQKTSFQFGERLCLKGSKTK